ncbi:hemicentin-1-like isoform X2 [Corticium candelabrum]|uniref:hemicentin-1-like isoform X2 n=1 Tax=Corticium candelabrum TaxID=121492 RepID=UPI002E265759|nr:hemicentin-1-like isoform X2 [Corticium candelabrum]
MTCSLHQDGGLYECFAEAGGLRLNASTWLRVIVPPVIHNVTNATAVVGENVTLTCLAKQHLFLRWKFNGSFVDHMPRYRVIGMGEQLVIKNIRETDHGWYLCQAFNEAFNSIEKVHLFVLIPPQMISGPQNTFVPLLWKVAFTCVSSGRPKPTSLWIHNKEVVALDKRPNVAIYPDHIEIANVTLQDEGEYCCEVVSDAGIAPSNCTTLTVLGHVAVLLSTVVHIMWGNKVTLNCSVASLDISEVQWTVNGAVVDSKLHSRLAQFDSRQLDVDGVLYSDSHLNIVCSVKVNDSAIAAERFWLNVSEAVGAPTEVSVSALGYGVVLVSWKWSSVYKQSHRIVLYHDGLMVKSEVVGSEASSAAISYGTGNTKYIVIVEAISAEGVYLPSKPVEFTSSVAVEMTLVWNGFEGDDTTSDVMARTRGTPRATTRSTIRSHQSTPPSHSDGKASSNFVIPVVVCVCVPVIVGPLVIFLIVRKRITTKRYETQHDSKSTKDMEIDTSSQT